MSIGSSVLSRLRPIGARLRADSHGATAVEYGLILSLVVLAMFPALHYFGETTLSMWNLIVNEFTKAR